MESAGTGTNHLGSKSARLGLDITKTRVVTLLLRVELVKYARKKGYAQKSDDRERRSQLFVRLQALACMKYQVIRSLRYHLFFFDILYHSRSRLKFSNGLYMMKIVN